MGAHIFFLFMSTVEVGLGGGIKTGWIFKEAVKEDFFQ
jgi:hypothetical protein